MSKIHFFERALTMNLVFLFCLVGSILFVAASQMKDQQEKLSAGVNSSQPGTQPANPESQRVVRQVVIRQYYIQNS